MADGKKQHYVPQFYLRNFSKDGKTIGCGYVDTVKPSIIETAPIKTQAAEDYFYTKDTHLETEFSKIEQKAKEIIQQILSSNFVVDSQNEDFLKQYICFQQLRTPFYANHFESEMNKMCNFFNCTDDGEKRISLQAKQIFVLSTFQDAVKSMQRYNLLLINNPTEIPFITSPEPATFFNPYKSKRKQFIGGVKTHGGMFYLPLSASKGILLYDNKAYRANKGIALCSMSDVSNLNAQIFITMKLSNTNIFYYDNTNSKELVFETLAKMKNYIGEYAKFDFIREKFCLFYR